MVIMYGNTNGGRCANFGRRLDDICLLTLLANFKKKMAPLARVGVVKLRVCTIVI